MAEESRDLALVHVEREVVHSNSAGILILLAEEAEPRLEGGREGDKH